MNQQIHHPLPAGRTADRMLLRTGSSRACWTAAHVRVLGRWYMEFQHVYVHFFPPSPPLDIAIGVEHAKDKAKMVAEAITAAVALVDPLIGTF